MNYYGKISDKKGYEQAKLNDFTINAGWAKDVGLGFLVNPEIMLTYSHHKDCLFDKDLYPQLDFLSDYPIWTEPEGGWKYNTKRGPANFFGIGTALLFGWGFHVYDTSKWDILTGPAMRVNVIKDLNDYYDDFNAFGASWKIGLDYTYRNHVLIRGQIDFPMTNVHKTEWKEKKQKTFTIGIGYVF